jgi:hypothetical protein
MSCWHSFHPAAVAYPAWKADRPSANLAPERTLREHCFLERVGSMLGRDRFIIISVFQDMPNTLSFPGDQRLRLIARFLRMKPPFSVALSLRELGQS